MAIDWTRKYRPQTFDEMALYPLLRKRLDFYAKTGDFSHLLMIGDTGVGKTTAARILGGEDCIEHNCAKDGTKKDMFNIAKSITAKTLWGNKRRILIMDEFHEVPTGAQTIFNKTMEDDGERNTFIFCVNSIKDVAPPIVSRCLTLRFDAGILHPTTEKLLLHKHTGITKTEWITELKRVGALVAKKDGKTATQKQLNIVADNDVYIVDARRYLRELEEQIKMDELD